MVGRPRHGGEIAGSKSWQELKVSTEADTCRKYVLPKLIDAGWDNEPHSFTEQRTFTDGRIVVSGNKVRRKKQKRADYLLRHTADFPIGVVEAKADYKRPTDGLQQAKEYAQILDLKFAYSTNGTGIVEFDFLTGVERELTTFPTPDELWQRLGQGENLTTQVTGRLLTPSCPVVGNHIIENNPTNVQAALEMLLEEIEVETTAELGALQPSILDKAFNGCLRYE